MLTSLERLGCRRTMTNMCSQQLDAFLMSSNYLRLFPTQYLNHIKHIVCHYYAVNGVQCGSFCFIFYCNNSEVTALQKLFLLTHPACNTITATDITAHLYTYHTLHSFKLLAHTHEPFNPDTYILSCPILGFCNRISCKKYLSISIISTHKHAKTRCKASK